MQGTFRVPESTASLPLATPLHQQPRHYQCRAGVGQPVPSGSMSSKKGFRLSSTLTSFPTAAHTSNPAPHSQTAWSLPANSKLLSLRSGDLAGEAGKQQRQRGIHRYSLCRRDTMPPNKVLQGSLLQSCWLF